MNENRIINNNNQKKKKIVEFFLSLPLSLFVGAVVAHSKKSFEMLSNQRRIMRKKQNKKEKKINFLIQKYLHDLVYLLYLNLY